MNENMRYRLVMSNPAGSFTIRHDELEKVLDGRRLNTPTVFVEGIVMNWNMVVSIVPDKDRMRDIRDLQAVKGHLDEPSPFAHLLAAKKEMLSPGSRTKAQEKSAREERNQT